MGFVERCADAAGMPLDSPDVHVDQRGMQHLVLVDRRRGVVARFPRTAAGCRLVGDAARRLHMLRRHGMPVPEVLQSEPFGGVGEAHLLLRHLPGVGLDTLDTDLLPQRSRDRLVDDLLGVTAALHDLPVQQWPSPAADWAGLWDGLVQRVLDSPHLAAAERDRGLVAAQAAAAVARRCRIGVFHGDLGGVNCRIDPDSGAVTGVLDWDSATVGDVATDLVAVLHGVGPATAARLRRQERWDLAWREYEVYVRTWPVQEQLWRLASSATLNGAATPR